ncbi:PA2169 family four-helix-bundle protein [Rhodocytophaga aerolata]|uniref:PA2169 family four-helix-bundle protein n=1 Tax=Rhodocytophaga aerolata TaxID=455078 RepID=A0ABT8R972_9BACT|nr:PA2169 family four-helix-bundle protein [Rhodocytophaga aerolata]MDO1447763.1 PA2169 family four-helix-bundle protein [Rhodocytophaga aerolata]
MEDIRKKTLSVLQNLIEINNDGNHGYRLAADKIENQEYATLFHAYAQQRALFASELEREANLLGKDVDGNEESILGAIHRGWINIKSVIAGGDSEAILRECETGDKAAVEAYEKAMKENLPSNIEAVLRKQYADIAEAYNKIKTFKHVTS